MVSSETWYLAMPYDAFQYNREFTKMFIEFASIHIAMILQLSTVSIPI